MVLSNLQIYSAAGDTQNIVRVGISLMRQAVVVMLETPVVQVRQDLASRIFLDRDNYARRFLTTMLADGTISGGESDTAIDAAVLAQWDVHTNPTDLSVR